MAKAIVLGCGVGVIRSLATAGIKVIALYSVEHNDYGRFSRFISQKYKVPSVIEESGGLLDFLLKTEKDWDGALLIPLNDVYAAFLAQNREALSNRYILAVQGWDIIKRILNKGSLYRQAQEIAVPLPKILFPDSVEYLMQRQDELSYPCILKPCETHRFFPIFGKKLFIINSFEELIEKFNEAQRNRLEVMVSEIIPGADDQLYCYVSYKDGNGDILAEMCMQKLRQYPPCFGNGRVAKTVPMIQQIRCSALKLLNKFSYHGFSSAEFKYDHQDCQYKLIEINIRPELQESLFTAAGINFPHIIYRDLVEGVRMVVPDYQKELFWIDSFNDIIASIRLNKDEDWRIKDYLSPYFKKKVFSVPFFDDPLPFIVNSWILVKQVSRSLTLRVKAEKNKS